MNPQSEAKAGSRPYISKALAAWLALGLGSLGVHRLYVYGWKDRWAWLHPWPTLAGLYGVQRMNELGQDDHLAWVLMPLLGLMLSIAMLQGIIWGLQNDEQWNARHNSELPVRRSGWAAVIAVIACLFLGGTALMSTIAFSAQRYFESQAEAARALSQ